MEGHLIALLQVRVTCAGVQWGLLISALVPQVLIPLVLSERIPRADLETYCHFLLKWPAVVSKTLC